MILQRKWIKTYEWNLGVRSQFYFNYFQHSVTSFLLRQADGFPFFVRDLTINCRFLFDHLREGVDQYFERLLKVTEYTRLGKKHDKLTNKFALNVCICTANNRSLMHHLTIKKFYINCEMHILDTVNLQWWNLWPLQCCPLL